MVVKRADEDVIASRLRVVAGLVPVPLVGPPVRILPRAFVPQPIP